VPLLAGSLVGFSQYEGVTNAGDYRKVIDYIEVVDDRADSGAAAAVVPLALLVSSLMLNFFK